MPRVPCGGKFLSFVRVVELVLTRFSSAAESPNVDTKLRDLFYAQYKSEISVHTYDLVMTPTTKENVDKVCDAISDPVPLLLEGNYSISSVHK